MRAGKSAEAEGFFIGLASFGSDPVRLRAHRIHPFGLVKAASFRNSNHFFHQCVQSNVFG